MRFTPSSSTIHGPRSPMAMPQGLDLFSRFFNVVVTWGAVSPSIRVRWRR